MGAAASSCAPRSSPRRQDVPPIRRERSSPNRIAIAPPEMIGNQSTTARAAPAVDATSARFKSHGHDALTMASFTAEHQARRASTSKPAEPRRRSLRISWRRGSDLDEERVPGNLSLSKTLRDDEASGALMAFARADVSEENLEFWFAVNDCRRAWDEAGAAAASGYATVSEARTRRVKELIATFLKEGAPKQVCIGDQRVQAVIAAAESGTFERTSFDGAQMVAELSLAQDIFPRFVESAAGQRLSLNPGLCD